MAAANPNRGGGTREKQRAGRGGAVEVGDHPLGALRLLEEFLLVCHLRVHPVAWRGGGGTLCMWRG